MIKCRLWNQDKVQEAVNLAAEAHKGQLVPGQEFSYLAHLMNVTTEVMNTVEDEHDVDPQDLLITALLHDCVEDTEVTADEIEQRFGKEVKVAVLALTKGETLPRELQIADSISRIKSAGILAGKVKLADRITNLQPAPKHWTAQKRAAYLEEARHILRELRQYSAVLAKRLEQKIEEYSKHSILP